MDSETAVALCAIFTVVIGIVGLGRSEQSAFVKKKEAAFPSKR